jgi:hypothetical protein
MRAGTHWREIILHAFTDSNGDGEQPEATPVFGPGGVLYGTTANASLQSALQCRLPNCL